MPKDRQSTVRVALAAVALLCLVAAIASASRAAELGELHFERDVRPILKVHCFHCHGETDDPSGGLDLRLVWLMREGGYSGEAIVPHDAEASLLWEKISSDEMPEGPKKLSPHDKATIRAWINQGAQTARPEPENVDDARFSYEELSHWAFQPVTRPEVPWLDEAGLRTPIDAFISRRLADASLTFSPAADRSTLARRLAFDLHGLPPDPRDVNDFTADRAPDAELRLIDRMLASPRFGVRWGRHWLDVVGYAETDGAAEADTSREAAWRYRDYVVDAFNTDKPIDQFYTEQLAGDELLAEATGDGDPDIHNPRHLELLTATGFLRMAPDATQTSNTLSDRNLAAAASLQVVGSTLLGVTVGCAQCHDHKYDPIGADDYYRLRAVFDPAFPLEEWQTPQQRLIDFTTEEVAAERERIEAEAKALEDDLNRRREEKGQEIQELKLADVPEDEREAVRAAVLASSAEQSEDQRRLLDRYPMVKPVPHILGLLVEYDSTAYRAFEKEFNAIAELRATKPPQRLVMATRERPGVVPVSHVMFRGDPESPGEVATPAELMVLRRARDVDVPADDASLPTTGRRLKYARQLTAGDHPLTARVFVNRLWQHHFGRGLVATSSDFGLAGEAPSHPQLLDWLADEFTRDWDQKRLHRLILSSQVYGQVAQRSGERDAVDPENALLARMNLRRLDAEAIRDSILLVSGGLDEQLGGPNAPVTEDLEGKIVIGRTTMRDGLKSGVAGENAAAARRSIYIEVRRRQPLEMLAAFDQPAMDPNCPVRRSSTVATQSLWFLNDASLVERSERWARRLMRSQDCDAERVEQAFWRLFAAPPSPEEMESCLAFLAEQTERIRASRGDDEAGDSPELRSLATLCQMLLASNRFLYVD